MIYAIVEVEKNIKNVVENNLKNILLKSNFK